jgi:hypothetical protein
MTRGYGEYRPAGEQDQSFDDPPRSWARVAALAGAWALVLALGSWIVPAVAAGGPGGDANIPASERGPESAREAAWVYLQRGSENNAEQFNLAICDGADPEVGLEELAALTSQHEEGLRGRPQIETETDEQAPSDRGAVIDARVRYLHSGRIAEEEFTVTVVREGSSYCVIDAIHPIVDQDGASLDNLRQVAVDFLNSIAFERNPDGALQCENYDGVDPQLLIGAIEAWEAQNGEAIGTASRRDNEPVSVTVDGRVFPYNVVLRAVTGNTSYQVDIEVTYDGCVSTIFGGEELLEEAGN